MCIIPKTICLDKLQLIIVANRRTHPNRLEMKGEKYAQQVRSHTCIIKLQEMFKSIEKRSIVRNEVYIKTLRTCES